MLILFVNNETGRSLLSGKFRSYEKCVSDYGKDFCIDYEMKPLTH